MKDAMEHIAFAVKLCPLQAKLGRKFMIEQPVGANSWGTQLMNKLLFVKNAGKVNFDSCMFDMMSDDHHGIGHAKKRTSIITNSEALLTEMKKHQCHGGHRHVTLLGWKAKACQTYTDKFCELVCKTVMNEKNHLDRTAEFLGRLSLGPAEARDVTKAINELINGDPHEKEALYDPYEFFDDVTGQSLDSDRAKEARKLEMQFFRNMKVYEKVPRWMAARDGCKVITTRWLDINKGDQQNPNYRSRLVGREIRTDSRLDLFAATPPLESLRIICSMCASNQDRRNPYMIMSVDVRRAYFYAKATRPVYIEIPIEDFEPGDEGRVARLNMSLYGTRDAAQNWAREYTTFLE